MQPWQKRLNEMNRLEDMLHFPLLVHAGATANVLLTVAATWYVQPRWPGFVGVWVAAVLLLNLLPVALLRLSLGLGTHYPSLQSMSFVKDQHKFSDWVYVAASANMAFWILLAWTAFAVAHSVAMLAGVEGIAFVATFAPVLLRPMLRRGAVR